MMRWFSLGLTVVFSIGLSAPAGAQLADYPYGYGSDAVAYGRSLDRIEPYGGFGLEMMQTPIAGTVIVDRFGLVHGNPHIELPSHVMAPSPRTKVSRYAPRRRVAARVGYQLPTGSLDWAGASGVILYSPALRYQNYGGGYGRGPYGTMDYGMMYHGMSFGY
jgi:hypothetical protein